MFFAGVCSQGEGFINQLTISLPPPIRTRQVGLVEGPDRKDDNPPGRAGLE